MKKCRKCGRILEDAENYCPTCGYDFMTGANTVTLQRSPYDIPDNTGKDDYSDGYDVVSRPTSTTQGYGSRNSVNYNPPEKKNGWGIFGKIMCGIILIGVIFIALKAFGVVDIVFDNIYHNSDTGVVSVNGSETDQKIVPDVVGFKSDVAQEKIREAGFSYVVEYKKMNGVADDLVIEQKPEPYAVVKANTEIKITVAKSVLENDSGSEKVKSNTMVRVPDIVGLKLEDGIKKLEENSLIPYVSEYEYSETTAEGYIMSQNPSGGSGNANKVAEGSTVYLIVSKGKNMSEYVKLDNYTGYDINEVKKALEGMGLNVEYSYSDNDDYPKDNIISQYPGADTYLSKGDVVSFSVSNGKKNSDEKSETQKPVFGHVTASSELKPQDGYTYYASNALHDDNTCWTEGVSGNGVGEYIMLYDDKVQTVKGCHIKNGYTYDSTVFKKNSRMSKVTFEFSDGDRYTAEIDPDSRDVQTIEFPKAVDTKSLKIIIEEVKSGDSYDDTCITLIMPY